MDNILSCWVVRPVPKDFALHFDVSSRLQTLEFRALLLQVVGWRNAGPADEARLDAVIASYRASATIQVLAVSMEGALAGILALDLVAPARAVIRHIVVDHHQRGHGLGRAMIEAAVGHWGLAELEAETAPDAVDFYRRCGFGVQSLGEKFPGSERFRCVLGGGQQAE
jgi:GNAT superfamily N-acetyltransferase